MLAREFRLVVNIQRISTQPDFREVGIAIGIIIKDKAIGRALVD